MQEKKKHVDFLRLIMKNVVIIDGEYTSYDEPNGNIVE